MSKLQVDTIVDKEDVSAPTLSKGAIVTGVTTSTSFAGALTGDVTGNITGNQSGGSVNATTGDFSSKVTVSTDVNVSGTSTVGVLTATSAVVGSAVTSNADGIVAAGIVTAGTCFKTGDGVFGAGIGATITGAGDAVFAGICTATSFVGDGTGLTGVASTDNIITGVAVTITDATATTSAGTGALQVTGGIGVGASVFVTGNVIIGTSGKGIDFSAQTSSSATDAAATQEVLDHYEYGTWTPVVKQGSTVCSGTNSGAVYTRIGNLVVAQCTITSIDDSGAGNLAVHGMPFNRGQGDPTGHLRWQGVTSSGQIMPYIGASIVYMQDMNTSGYVGDISNSNTSSTFNFYSLQLIYHV